MNVLEQALSAAELSVEQFELFTLVMIRVSFIIFLMPFLDNNLVLSRLKVGLTFFISLAIFPMLSKTNLLVLPGTGLLFYLILKEAFVGILIGMTGFFLFAAVDFGAEIMNREIGLNQSPIMDPTSGENSTAMGQFILKIFSVIFLMAGYHHYFFHLLVETFQVIPLGGLHFEVKTWAMAFTAMVAESILYGTRIAAPVFASVLLTLVGMAFVTKVMPQLNIWIISIPIKVVVGILTLYFALPLTFSFFEILFGRLQQYGRLLIKVSGNGG